jgi:putative peptidoglycan lipid II flippase
MTSRLIRQSLVAATLITVGGNLLGRILGFGREAVLAKYFGTSAILDTFILAFTLPELVALILFTALPVALIPAVAGKSRSDADDGRLFWSGLILFAICFGLLASLIYVGRGYVLGWLAPGLSPEHQELARQLLALLSPYVWLRGMEAYFRSWCFAKKRFVAPALSSVIMNVVVIASILLWYDQLEIRTLAVGWLSGAAILFIYNGAHAFRVIRPGRPRNLDLPWARNLLIALGGVACLESLSMIYAVIDRHLASQYLAAGPISALRYASTLISIPGGVLVAAFNIASFPWIAELVSRGKLDRLRQMYSQSVRLLIFAMSLVAVGILIFSEDIVRVAFARGAFDLESLELTSRPFGFFAIGLVFQAVYAFQMRFYYARRAIYRLGLILGVMLTIKVASSFLLIGPMGHSGLALATSLARIIGFLIMTIDLARTLNISNRELYAAWLPKVVVSLGVAFSCWFGINWLWPSPSDLSLWSLFLKLSLLAVTGVAVYGGVGLLLKLPEPKRALDLLASPFKRDR